MYMSYTCMLRYKCICMYLFSYIFILRIMYMCDYVNYAFDELLRLPGNN